MASKRRSRREPLDKGGWSILHTLASGITISTPIGNHYVRGLGNTGWFSWFKDETIEELTEKWLLASTAAERDRLLDAIRRQAFQQKPTVPLGQFQLYDACRRNITNVVAAFGALFRNIRRG